MIPQVLNELRVIEIGGTPKDDDYAVFAYRGYVFLYDSSEYSYEIPWEEMAEETVVDLTQVKKDVEREGISTDWFKGSIRDGWLYPDSSLDLGHHPASSRLMNQIVKALNLEGGVRSEADATKGYETEEEPYPASTMKEKLPDVLYHGTVSDSLFGPTGILRVGLRPGGQMGKSQWGEMSIVHSEAVFLGTFVGAKFHAGRAAKKSKKEKEGFPVVLGVRVPDKERLVADYDIDAQSGGTTFPRVHRHSQEKRDQMFGRLGKEEPSYGRTGRGPLKTSIDVMRVGYFGRIPAKFIVEFYYYSKASTSWERTDIKELQTMQETSEKYGSEYYEADPSEFEEEDY